ncbi:MAG TPA: regulatory protein RecX, partial [bacterium]|nr:regulatory protein RecX [bacterium]
RRSDGVGRTASERPLRDGGEPARIVLVRAGGDEVRVVVLGDGRRLRVDAEDFARFALEAGLTLAPATLEHLERRDAYRRARETALRLLGTRARTIADLRARLRRLDVTPETAASVVDDLTADGYLDDLEFARTWVRARLAIRAYGALRLRSELREKGVAISFIEQAIREVYGEEDAAVAEERRARDLAERRLRGYARLDWEVRVRRLAGFLQRRGFAAPTIARVLRTVQRSRESSDA